VDRQQFFDTLDLDDDAFFDDEIDAIRSWELHAFVCHWQADLVLKLQTDSPEFETETSVVCALEESRTQRAMNLHRRTDRFVAHFIGTHCQSSLCVLRRLCVLCAASVPFCTASGVLCVEYTLLEQNGDRA
jgi:hypothetical protein